MNNTADWVMSLLAQFSGQGNTLTIPVPYVKLTGSIEGGLLLNQIVYWSDRTKMQEGWFAKSYDEWEAEIFLTRRTVSRLVGILRRIGVETKIRRFNGSPTLHYRLDRQKFENALHSVQMECDVSSHSKTTKRDIHQQKIIQKTTKNTERKRSTRAPAAAPKTAAHAVKYPLDTYKYQGTHIAQYQSEHSATLDALITAWGSLYRHLTEMPLYDARQFIVAHQDLLKLNVPISEYGLVIAATRKKFAWRLTKGSSVTPVDISAAITDYLTSKQAAPQSTPDQQAAADKRRHDYEEMFGAK